MLAPLKTPRRRGPRGRISHNFILTDVFGPARVELAGRFAGWLEPTVNSRRYLAMERTVIILAILWFGFDALMAGLLTRRSGPPVRNALFRWLIGDQVPARPRELAHALVVAHRHHH